MQAYVTCTVDTILKKIETDEIQKQTHYSYRNKQLTDWQYFLQTQTMFDEGRYLDPSCSHQN